MPYFMIIVLLMAISQSLSAQEDAKSSPTSKNTIYHEVKSLCREESKQKNLKGISAIKHIKKCITNHPSVKALLQD